MVNKNILRRYFLLAASLLYGAIGFSQKIWNPNHSIGTLNGIYSYNYTQTPAQLVEIQSAGIPNTGFTYQWYSSIYPVNSALHPFTAIPGATAASYSPPALNSSSLTTYYYRVTTSSTALYLGLTQTKTYVSNIVKIAVVSVNWENLNYVREHDVLNIGQTTWTAIDQLPIGSKLQTTTYLDGLGRGIEKVSKQTATPATGSTTWGDIVQFSAYDQYGREPTKYLPYTTTNQSGKYKTAPLTDQPAYYANTATYNETSAFSSVSFDNSPLNRVTKVKEPGANWAASAGNSANYDMNTVADNVQILTTDYTQGDAPVDNGIYPANSLYKLTYTDVNGNQVIEFTNKSGQLILKKVQVTSAQGAGDGGWICTYTVYDDFGLLRFQIQPEGVKYLDANAWSFAGTNGATVLAEQVFQYNYDDKGRTIWKKAPGAQPLRMAYDIRDRVVYTQDGNQANATNTPQVVGYLYDALDRAVFNYTYNTSETFAQLQSDINQASPTSTVTITSSGGAPNIAGPVTLNLSLSPITFTSTAFNSGGMMSGLKFYFYDNYGFPSAAAFSSSYNNLNAYSNSDPNVMPIAQSNRTLSMPTGTMLIVENGQMWLTNTFYYDEKGRMVQSERSNIKGGIDIDTKQYRFDGRLLSNCNSFYAPYSGFYAFLILDKFHFDNIGRLTSIEKQVGSINPSKIIAAYDYDDMGRLKTKHLDPNYNNPNSGLPDLESLNYTYNIHNQITGINRDYALKTAGIYNKWGHFFGMDIGYDKKDNVFSGTQLNGQVAGIVWNTLGDDAQRKYDYTYDNAGRLTNAAFNQQQHPGDGWSNSTMDFSVSGTSGQITYDNNGNLLTMLQKGVMPGTAAPLTVDDLRYTYNSYSNRLANVMDMMTTTNLNGQFGDFKDGANAAGTPDYVYDANGNIVVDLNKNAQSLNGGAAGSNGIHYEMHDKPDQIRIVGKGTILIAYDADGNKLQRAFVPETGGTSTITSYIGAYVFQETSTTITASSKPVFHGTGMHLAYINFEEGRVRTMTPQNSSNLVETGSLLMPSGPGGGYNSGVWDFFIMDYQQNVRMILTEETKATTATCTMETASASTEDALFGQTGAANEVEATRTSTPAFWSGHASASVSHLGNLSGHNLGPNMLQKVMAGDKITAQVQYFYKNSPYSSSNPNIIPNLLSNMVSLIGGGAATVGEITRGAASNIGNQLNATPGFVNAVEPNSNTSGTPQAYLTILFFDERFNFIAAADGGVAQQQARSTDAGNTNAAPLALSGIKAPKNGYAYIYISNRSDQDVYFDNLGVVINAGNIIEEDHYYAFGLKIAAISSRKLGDVNEGKLSNPYGYNDKEMLDEDAGLGWLDYGFRNYDPQIGRFPQIDPLTDRYPTMTPYQYAANDPITNIDEDGLDPLGLACPNLFQDALHLGNSIASIVVDVAKIGSSIAVTTDNYKQVANAVKASDNINGGFASVGVGNGQGGTGLNQNTLSDENQDTPPPKLVIYLVFEAVTPQTYQHIKDVTDPEAGPDRKPLLLTYGGFSDKEKRDIRNRNTKVLDPKSDPWRDEYPFASTLEAKLLGSSVRYVPKWEQEIQRDELLMVTRNLNPGDKIQVVLIPKYSPPPIVAPSWNPRTIRDIKKNPGNWTPNLNWKPWAVVGGGIIATDLIETYGVYLLFLLL